MSIAYLRMSAVALVLTLTPIARAQTYKVLYSFTGGIDGGGVWGGVVMDKQGNLYGTTSGGGSFGYGTVFQLSPNSDGTWAETVLHSFANGDPDGQEPQSTLVLDGAGNLYGTAPLGGANGHGTAFELSPGSGGWTLAVLYNFGAYVGDAGAPSSGLTMDGHGNLYGSGIGGAICCGAVVELSLGATAWSETLLFSFGANNEVGGAYPFGRLLLDAAGDLYGTTQLGGDASGLGGCGVVYGLRRISGVWTESVLHTFGTLHGDGCGPGGERLAFDSLGNLYGTTGNGGGPGCGLGGCGTVFTVARKPGNRGESVLHKFGSGVNGAAPNGGLVFDASGNAYGTTDYGGPCGCGVVFRMTPNSNGGWVYTVLHAFSGADGGQPVDNLIMDGSGDLYGTTVLGGSGGNGVVFEITP